MSTNGNRYESIQRSAVPSSRKSKHHELVDNILQQAENLRGGKALRIPLSKLGDAKIQHIRASLSRASAKIGLNLATRIDDDYFYVWRQD